MSIVKAQIGTRNRALALGGLLGGFVFLWYLQPYPWLGAAMGILAGLFSYKVLKANRIERWRRVFFVSIMALSIVTLLAYAFSMGTPIFKQVVASWNPGYYFPGTSKAGAMPFPTPVVMPSIFWRGADFIGGLGLWQVTIPTSLAAFFLFMIPGILIFALFGRGICGWLCPLGGLPEIGAAAGREYRMPGFLKEKKLSEGGISFVIPKPWVHNIRYGLLAGVVLLSFAGGFALVNIFYPVLWLKSMPAFWTIVGVLAISGVALPLITRRRWWCYICPVGAVLSSLEKISLFRIKIDQGKCNKCMDCVRACRYYALTPQDVERGKCRGELCVRCGRCIEACSEQAIDITWLGSRQRAREPFLALATAVGFAFYAWFTIQSVYLFSKVSDFRWFG